MHNLYQLDRATGEAIAQWSATTAKGLVTEVGKTAKFGRLKTAALVKSHTGVLPGVFTLAETGTERLVLVIETPANSTKGEQP